MVSASRAVQVHTLPTPGIPRISSGRFLSFAWQKAPNLVALNPLGFHVADHVVVVLEDRFAQVARELLNGILGNPRNPGGGPNRATIDQAPDDRTALFAG